MLRGAPRFSIVGRHIPRKRNIRYAAPFRLSHCRTGILGRPPSRAM